MSDIKLHTHMDDEILRDTTRKERRNLLIFSVIGLLVSKGGFVPTEITAFGIKFSEANKEFILYGVGIAIAFYFVSFSINAISDLLKSKVKRWERTRDGIVSGTQELDPETFDRLHTHSLDAQSLSRPIAVIFLLRVLFEVFASLTVATYSLYSIF